MHYKTNITATLSIIFFGFLFSSDANAGIDVHELASYCESQPAERIFCGGRILGIFDMLLLNAPQLSPKSDTPTRTLAICNVHGEQSNAALAQIFMNWAKAHPEQWNQPDIFGVVSSLNEKWPCK